MNIDPVALTIVADLFANLSAGWFGAALVVPVVSTRPHHVNIWLLLTNAIFGIVSLVIAYQLKRITGEA